MATYYINPDFAGGGNNGSLSNPWTSYSDATISTGNTYKQKRGTSTAEQVTIDFDNVVLSSYFNDGDGSDDPAQPRPIISGSSGARDYCIYVDDASNVTVENLRLTQANLNGFYARATNSNAQSGLTLTNVEADNTISTANGENQGAGIYINSAGWATARYDDILIDSCYMHDNSYMGMDSLGDLGMTVRNCLADNNGAGKAGQAFSIHSRWFNANSAYNWTNVSGNVYSSSSLITNDTPDRVAHYDSSTGVGTLLTYNPGATTTVGAWEYDYSGTTLYINLNGADPDGANDEITVRRIPQPGPIIFEDCTATNQIAFNNLEGMGFCCDDMSANVTVRRCHAEDCEGPAFRVNQGDNNYFVGSTAYRCATNSGTMISLSRISSYNRFHHLALVTNTGIFGPYGCGDFGDQEGNEVISCVVETDATTTWAYGCDAESQTEYKGNVAYGASGTEMFYRTNILTGNSDFTSDTLWTYNASYWSISGGQLSSTTTPNAYSQIIQQTAANQAQPYIEGETVLVVLDVASANNNIFVRIRAGNGPVSSTQNVNGGGLFYYSVVAGPAGDNHKVEVNLDAGEAVVFNSITFYAIRDNIEADPLLDANYKPTISSPCVGAGTKTWGNDPRPDGYDGEPFPDTEIDIGAYQTTFDPNHPANL